MPPAAVAPSPAPSLPDSPAGSPAGKPSRRGHSRGSTTRRHSSPGHLGQRWRVSAPAPAPPVPPVPLAPLPPVPPVAPAADFVAATASEATVGQDGSPESIPASAGKSVGLMPTPPESASPAAPEVVEAAASKPKQSLASDESGSPSRALALPGPAANALELNPDQCATFGKAVFSDKKWEYAQEHLCSLDNYGPDLVRAVLCQGAKSFGIWHLPEACLQGLVKQVMALKGEKVTTVSPAVERLEQMCQEGPQSSVSGIKYEIQQQSSISPKMVDEYRKSQDKQASKRTYCMNLLVRKFHSNRTHTALWIFIFLISNGYALKVVLHSYPEALERFLFPIYFARMGGMACALWTSVMFFTMARGLLSRMYVWLGGLSTKLITPLDEHKDIHILSGGSLTLFAGIHVVAHLLGTVPGILTSKLKDLEFLGCDDRSRLDFDVPMPALMWPKCPLEKVPETVWEILFMTMPGLTGVILTALLFLFAYTARDKGRKAHFDWFWYVHMVGVFLWPIAMFFHGSNTWVGVGFPLVVLAAGVPITFYLWDKVCRYIRYYFFVGSRVKIAQATIRPGKDNKDDSAVGALTYLEITEPPFLWNFRPGMYAFICMPEYAPLQWHPFTICSGEDDETADFLIAGVGDWTQYLAKNCMSAQRDGKNLPVVALDGPYMAPTQSALAKEVLVAVGAGVGITPFLSLMSTIISQLGQEGGKTPKYEKLKEVHFYWMTRSADEFLFGRKYFTKICESSKLRNKVYLHLHITSKAPDSDPCAYLFREALKRQSKVDLERFQKMQKPDFLRQVAGPLLPIVWMDSAKEDVLWVSDLVTSMMTDQGRGSGAAWQRAAARVPAEWCVCTRASGAPRPKDMQKSRSSYAGHWAAGLTSSRRFGTRTLSSETMRRRSELSMSQNDCLLPVVFGRPNFASEIRAIGKAKPGCDVDIYICGGDAIVKNMQDVASVCNEHAARDSNDHAAPRQHYHVHFERFN